MALRALLDPNGPMLAVTESEDPGNENGAGGWAGGVAPLLRGSTIDAIRAVPNDRIINIDVGSRSAFGVPARHRLTFELEPRKSNIIVLRPIEHSERFTVLAALRVFTGDGGTRSLSIGEDYEPPPRQRSSLSVEGFATLADASEAREVRGLARLLGLLDPQCTPPIARDIVTRCLQRGAPRVSRCLLEGRSSTIDRVRRAASSRDLPIYVYRSGAVIAACHLVPLAWEDGEPETVASLNDVCAAQLTALAERQRAPGASSLRKKLQTMLTRCDGESARLRERQSAAERADEFRRAGDAIFANLASIGVAATEFRAADGMVVRLDPALSPKANAAAYFRRYKKARSGLSRIAQRLEVLSRNKEFYEQLLWDLDRAESLPSSERDAVCRDVSDAAGIRQPGRAGRPVSRKARRDEPVSLPDGAVAYVGRSPKHNERLTFGVASPDDYWFHARGVPGAHVVVKPATPRGSLSSRQIRAAAELAASHSRAADATSVVVDYTRRKHVRRQGKGRPGLVWYTDFKTVAVKR